MASNPWHTEGYEILAHAWAYLVATYGTGATDACRVIVKAASEIRREQ